MKSQNLNIFNAEEVGLLLKALSFSAQKHRQQRRKDGEASPYINHPIQVAQLLWEMGKVTDMIVIIAALLHDTLEDTATTAEEIAQLAGPDILALVQEVTDDKSLPKLERKRLQIAHAPHLSKRAKLLKLADKICNVYDVTHFPPQNWSLDRRREYLDWSQQVVAGLRGVNVDLEHHYDQLSTEARQFV
jgi:guanosine-3',5'-bis(diphosphate) 3'-pyrophosphohydrolase